MGNASATLSAAIACAAKARIDLIGSGTSPHGVSGSQDLAAQPLVDLVESPGKGRPVLGLLEIGDDRVPGVGQAIGEDNDPIPAQDRVGVGRDRAICRLGRARGGDLLFERGQDEERRHRLGHVKATGAASFTARSRPYPRGFRGLNYAGDGGIGHNFAAAYPARQVARVRLTNKGVVRRPNTRKTLLCVTCEIEIVGAPTFHLDLAFCCDGCVVGGPCICSYDLEVNGGPHTRHGLDLGDRPVAADERGVEPAQR